MVASAQGDEQGKADTEDGERDEEVGVGEDGSGLVGELHGSPVGERGMDWGNHKDAWGGVSRMGLVLSRRRWFCLVKLKPVSVRIRFHKF